MSGIRQSYVIAREEKFGKGRGSNPWFAPPPGTFISFTHNRSVSKIYTAGSKFIDEFAFGAVTGSFEWTFTMDYKYLASLALAFEDYTCKANDDGSYTHTFKKANDKRVPSFCIRRKIMNRMANGGIENTDEISEVYGCVVRNLTFSIAAGSSQISVTMTGLFTDEKMALTDLEATDYKEADGQLVEWQCLFDGDSPSCDTYIGDVDSLGVTIENSAAAIYSTCTPIAKNFYEGQTSFTLKMTTYSNNPHKFKNRMYSGGSDNTTTSPKIKQLEPWSTVTLASYSLSMRDDGYSDVASCIEASPMSATFTIKKAALQSLTWQKGDGSKLMDQLTSTSCQNMILTIKSTVPPVYSDSGTVEPFEAVESLPTVLSG